MPDAPQLAIAALTMLVASTVMSALGFGIGLTATPVLLLFLEPQTVVVMLNTIAVGLFALVLFETKDDLAVGQMTPVAIAGVLGVPFGVFALSSLSDTVLRIGITVLVLVLTGAIVLNVRWSIPRPRVVGPLLGFIVAALVAGLAIGGPLMVLFLLSRKMHRHALRASMSFFFLAMEATAVVGYGIAGLFTLERVELIALVAVPALLGYRVASMFVRRMNERTFRQGVVALIAVTSLMVLGREVLSL